MDLRAAQNHLQTLTDAHRWGVRVLHAPVPLMRSSSRFAAGRSGKPTSSPPSGTDLHLRAALVACSQHLMQAIRELHTWEWDFDAWEPHGIVYTVNRGTAENPVWLVSCDSAGKPCYRDPWDLTTPLVDVGEGVTQLRGMVGSLQTLDWSEGSTDVDEADRDILAAGLAELRQAVSRLRGVGVWTVPEGFQCIICLASGVHAKNRCEPCYRYRERTGEERPRRLWVA